MYPWHQSSSSIGTLNSLLQYNPYSSGSSLNLLIISAYKDLVVKMISLTLLLIGWLGSILRWNFQSFGMALDRKHPFKLKYSRKLICMLYFKRMFSIVIQCSLITKSDIHLIACSSHFFILNHLIIDLNQPFNHILCVHISEIVTGLLSYVYSN